MRIIKNLFLWYKERKLQKLEANLFALKDACNVTGEVTTWEKKEMISLLTKINYLRSRLNKPVAQLVLEEYENENN